MVSCLSTPSGALGFVTATASGSHASLPFSLTSISRKMSFVGFRNSPDDYEEHEERPLSHTTARWRWSA